MLLDRGSDGPGGRMRGSARSVLGREAMDVAGAAPPRVDCGAAFLRGTDPRLRPVLSMLEGHGLVRRWEGRYEVRWVRGHPEKRMGEHEFIWEA